MNINPISVMTPIKPFKTTFNTVPAKNIGFGATPKDNSYDDFLKWADNTGLINRLDTIKEDNKVIKGNKEEKLYELNDTDKWLLQVHERPVLAKPAEKLTDISRVRDDAPDKNFGQIIAHFNLPYGGEYTQTAYILKRQSGTPHGIDVKEPFHMNKKTIEKHIESLKTLANFPQESYDKLVKEVKELNENGYKLNCDNPVNFIIDDEKKEINFTKVDREKVRHSQNPDVLNALMGGLYSEVLEHVDTDEKLIELSDSYASTIFTKYMLALKTNGIKY